MKTLTNEELEALKNFLAEPYRFNKANWEAARDAWLATPFMKTADKAVKAVDRTAYAWVDILGKNPPINEGLLRLEIRFESVVEGTTGPDGCEASAIEVYAEKKAAMKAAKLSRGFEKALEAAGIDVQRTGDPLDGVGPYYATGHTNDDGDIMYGKWVAWTSEEPVLVFEVDCLPGTEEEGS